MDDGDELLYLSPDASIDEGQAIRGGIPICWPQFNTRGPLPKHGFARNAVWRLHGQDDTSLLLELTPDDLSDEMRAAWPHQFQLRQKIDLAPGQLTVTLDVSNQGQTPFDFTTALHTYLRVADLTQVQLAGLERAAINAPMQGTAADLIKLSMVKVQQVLDAEQRATKMIMQVHDELVFEVPEDEVEWVRTEIPRLMAGVADLKVPLLAEVGVGPNWDKAH